MQEVLEGGGFGCELTRVDTREAFCELLEQGVFDLIFADYTLPSFDGSSALRLAAERRPEVPFIFVSGTIDEELASRARSGDRLRLQDQDLTDRPFGAQGAPRGGGEVAPRGCGILGDRVQLQQVLLNAIEAMSAAAEAPRELVVATAEHDATQALVSVRDTGTGLAEARGAHVRRVLHDEVGRHGHGTRDLPFHRP